MPAKSRELMAGWTSRQHHGDTKTEPVGLSAMTKAELQEHADSLGIDTSGASTKADLLALVESHQG